MSDEVIAFFCGLAIGAISIATFDDLWRHLLKKLRVEKFLWFMATKRHINAK